MPYKDPLDRKAAQRRHWLRENFGITVEEYDEQLRYQGGRCAVCGGLPSSDRSLAVDHCHQSEELRGLLCTPCNVALGVFLDNPDILRIAIAYLKDGAAPGDILKQRRERFYEGA